MGDSSSSKRLSRMKTVLFSSLLVMFLCLAVEGSKTSKTAARSKTSKSSARSKKSKWSERSKSSTSSKSSKSSKTSKSSGKTSNSSDDWMLPTTPPITFNLMDTSSSPSESPSVVSPSENPTVLITQLATVSEPPVVLPSSSQSPSQRPTVSAHPSGSETSSAFPSSLSTKSPSFLLPSFPPTTATAAPASVSHAVVQTVHLIGFEMGTTENNATKLAKELKEMLQDETDTFLLNVNTSRRRLQTNQPEDTRFGDAVLNVNCPETILGDHVDLVGSSVCYYVQSTIVVSNIDQDPEFCKFVDDENFRGRLKKEYEKVGRALKDDNRGSFIRLFDLGIRCDPVETSNASDDEGWSSGEKIGVAVGAGIGGIAILFGCCKLKLFEICGLASLTVGLIRLIRRYMMKSVLGYNHTKFTNNTDEKLRMLVREHQETQKESEGVSLESRWVNWLKGAIEVKKTQTVVTGLQTQHFLIKKGESRDVFVRANYSIAVLSDTENYKGHQEAGKILHDDKISVPADTREYPLEAGVRENEVDFISEENWEMFFDEFAQAKHRGKRHSSVGDAQQKSSTESTSRGDKQDGVLTGDPPESAPSVVKPKNDSSVSYSRDISSDKKQNHEAGGKNKHLCVEDGHFSIKNMEKAGAVGYVSGVVDMDTNNEASGRESRAMSGGNAEDRV